MVVWLNRVVKLDKDGIRIETDSFTVMYNTLTTASFAAFNLHGTENFYSFKENATALFDFCC